MGGSRRAGILREEAAGVAMPFFRSATIFVAGRDVFPLPFAQSWMEEENNNDTT